jgi:large subunit ribosomal protein L29
MKAKDMREKSLEDLRELEKSLAHDAFQAKFKNFTNRLDDSSQIQKLRRDLARVKTLLVEMQHAKEVAPVDEPSTVGSSAKSSGTGEGVGKAKAPGKGSTKRAVTKSAKAAQSEATK